MMTQAQLRPTISAVVCTYNGEKYVGAQIESILNQTYPVFEVIVQDDGSTDGTCSVVEAYARRDNRVRLFRNERGLGFNYNFSMAFLKAEGDYIASSDQDDVWHPQKIEKLVAQMRGKTLLFHNSWLFTSDIHQTSGLKNPANAIYNEIYLLFKPFVPGHECFFSRRILPLYMTAVDKEHHISYDSLLMVAAEVSGNIGFLNEGLTYWRRHSQATSINSHHHYGLLGGWLSAFKALQNPEKRSIAQRYFQAVSSFPFRSFRAASAVKAMTGNTTFGILKACCLCLLEHKQLYPYHGLMASCIKSFFTPLYFLRDCTNFIIH